MMHGSPIIDRELKHKRVIFQTFGKFQKECVLLKKYMWHVDLILIIDFCRLKILPNLNRC